MSTGRRTFSGFSKPAVQSIKKQEKELGQIIAKYRFKEKPERIYYVDDKMLYVPMARTPHVVYHLLDRLLSLLLRPRYTANSEAIFTISARPYWYPLLAANLK
jgi:hypothetical protein